ncbi:hypothetical protein CSKR_201165 [Clonorchis sinensis]|uniref:Uncharacterized protein n=1 Tax=Clonorchis sinensis TaxID=79923 RepID=A0A8T1MN83_CLOSI|nr:hypothetical protein CSKR_201165 [Clonorchis sinensis]
MAKATDHCAAGAHSTETGYLVYWIGVNQRIVHLLQNVPVVVSFSPTKAHTDRCSLSRFIELRTCRMEGERVTTAPPGHVVCVLGISYQAGQSIDTTITLTGSSSETPGNSINSLNRERVHLFGWDNSTPPGHGRVLLQSAGGKVVHASRPVTWAFSRQTNQASSSYRSREQLATALVFHGRSQSANQLIGLIKPLYKAKSVRSR